MADLLSSLIGAGANLLGANMAQNRQEEINNQNFQNNMWMAQHSIQYRVKDAEEAGINPLYAMGAPTMQAPIMQVGPGADGGLGAVAQNIRDFGNDTSRSATAAQPGASKVEDALLAQRVASGNLSLENMKLQNDLLRSKLALASQPGNPPSGAFVVPENPKPEQRPPLMAGGFRWGTNPNTSPMKAWEDQYGDEGPVASLLPLGILANDIVYNARRALSSPVGSSTAGDILAGPARNWASLPGQVKRWLYENYKY